MNDNDIIKALDILDKFEFFGGQRAGRELWLNKPYDVQNKDIGEFLRDVDFLKAFINRQKSEIDRLKAGFMRIKDGCGRVKTEGQIMLVCRESTFDNIVKELTEDQK